MDGIAGRLPVATTAARKAQSLTADADTFRIHESCVPEEHVDAKSTETVRRVVRCDRCARAAHPRQGLDEMGAGPRAADERL
jgi:hypothetical protein